MTLRLRRSVLYMPGSNQRALEKARTLAADAFIFDLEDAVAPETKDIAREQVVEALGRGGYAGRETIVRVNARDSVWWRADIEAAAKAGPDAILVPKVSTRESIHEAAAAVAAAGAPARTRIWAMIETPRAILEAASIAAAARDPHSRLAVFVMGTNDLAKETRARQIAGRASMLTWLSMAVAAARAHGLEIIDGAFGAIDDAEGLRRECAQGRDLGMDGKTLIHPNQIPIANETFAPSSEDIEEARLIVEAFDLPANAGRGAISIGGRMVERMHVDMARRTLSLAALVETRRF